MAFCGGNKRLQPFAVTPVFRTFHISKYVLITHHTAIFRAPLTDFLSLKLKGKRTLIFVRQTGIACNTKNCFFWHKVLPLSGHTGSARHRLLPFLRALLVCLL